MDIRTKTKVHFFFIVSILFMIISCEKDFRPREIVPYTRVNLSLSQNTEISLQTLLTPVYVPAANGELVGYRGHGIFVVQVADGEYRAFDASCTLNSRDEYHPDIEEHLIIDKKNPMLVVCPRCKSSFDLMNGNVQSGLALEGLQEYRTVCEAPIIRVFN